MADVLTHPQEIHRQIMPHKLLEHKEIIKKTSYHPCEPIKAVLSSAIELSEFANITGTSYTQHQASNSAHMIIYRTGNFTFANREWIHMPTVHKTWVGLKQFFQTEHNELHEITDTTVQDEGIHLTNMVRDVTIGIQEVLTQEKFPIEIPMFLHEQQEHVENSIQDRQKYLAAQLK